VLLTKAMLGTEQCLPTNIKTAAENEAIKPRIMTYLIGEWATRASGPLRQNPLQKESFALLDRHTQPLKRPITAPSNVGSPGIDNRKP
jgi:hypothetical protein